MNKLMSSIVDKNNINPSFYIISYYPLLKRGLKSLNIH